jgi:hypothetical protein
VAGGANARQRDDDATTTAMAVAERIETFILRLRVLFCDD